MAEIRWKVVREIDPSLGLTSFCPPEGLCVKYIPGEFVTAPVGGLLVFGSKYYALDFAAIVGQAWECEVEGPVELPPKRILDGPCELVERLWANKVREIRRATTRYPFYPFTFWPKHTEAYKRVKLTRRIS